MNHAFALAAAIGAAFGPALAQPPAPREGWTVSVGVAPFFGPIYQGADDYGVAIYPDIRVAYGERFFASVPEGVGFRVINTDRFKAGPIARIRFSRDADSGSSPFLIAGESDDLVGLDDIPAAGEFGAFAELGGRTLTLRAEARRGVGAHEAFIGDVSARYARRFGRTIASVGPQATFAGADYVDRYFGVSPAESATSGLPAFAAGGGVVSYGAGATVVRPLDARWSIAVIAGYERLAGDAARSPLVRLRGDRDQATIGVAFSYTLTGAAR